MSRRLKIAVRLHPGADGTAGDTCEQARHAERLDLDGIFEAHLLERRLHADRGCFPGGPNAG